MGVVLTQKIVCPPHSSGQVLPKDVLSQKMAIAYSHALVICEYQALAVIII